MPKIAEPRCERLGRVPGRFPVDAEINLQFRGGHLTGWKNNWRVPRHWIIY